MCVSIIFINNKDILIIIKCSNSESSSSSNDKSNGNRRMAMILDILLIQRTEQHTDRNLRDVSTLEAGQKRSR